MRITLCRKIGWLLILLLLALPGAGFAGEPQVTGGKKVREQLRHVFAGEGYMARFSNGQGLQRAMSAYLWDHRQFLKTVDFHNAAQIDVLVCLMIKLGYAGFEQCTENQSFRARCQAVLR